MLKKITSSLFALAFAASFAMAADTAIVNFDKGVTAGDILNSPAMSDVKAPAVQSTASQVKPSKGAVWTIMVYVNAKNNLEPFGLKDLNEMEMVGSSDKVNVVAELGRIRGYDGSDGNWTGSRRYLVQKDTNTNKITSPVVETIATADMGDWNHLVEFAKWAKEKYPAKYYMLIVWNHGAGWKNDPRAAKGISYDDETGNHITTPQLGQAMQSIGKVDVYGSDACLMQMAEVDYEIKDYVTYIVGSEETEPGDGYTYNTFLEKVKGTSTPLQVGKAAVDAYTDHYNAIGEGATQSLVATAQLEPFGKLLDEWVGVMMQSGSKTLAKKARSSALGFAYPENKDLYHFLSFIKDGAKDAALAQKTTELMGFIDGTLVVHNRTAQDNYSVAKGMAIYIPSSLESSYNSLKWAKSTKWADFVKWMK